MKLPRLVAPTGVESVAVPTDPDRRGAQPRHDHRHRERQLDAPQPLAPRHADPARRLEHRRLDARRPATVLRRIGSTA